MKTLTLSDAEIQNLLICLSLTAKLEKIQPHEMIELMALWQKIKAQAETPKTDTTPETTPTDSE